MTKYKHVSMSIEWFEKVLDSLSNDNIKNDKCKIMFWYSYKETKKILQEMKNNWILFIPAEWCDNIKSDGSCGC